MDQDIKETQTGETSPFATSDLRGPLSMIERQKILIVDDREENLIALERTLSVLDVDIIRARSGNSALAATLDNNFAVAILDVQMPGMDGYELAELLRGEENTRILPIIFNTASYADELYTFRGYEAGAIDYIIKPYAPEILQGKVRILLDLDRHRRRLERMVEARTDQLKHLNAILLGIRGINRLVIHEKDPARLIQKACDQLVQTRGFHSVFIVLLDNENKVTMAGHAGLGEYFHSFLDVLQRGEIPLCGQKALSQPGIILTTKPSSDCPDCPLTGLCQGRVSMTLRLEHDERMYGLMNLCVLFQDTEDTEELGLFEAVAGDIGFALSTIEMEKEHQQAERRNQLAREVLDLLNRQESSLNLVRDILLQIKKNTGFEAVAIRLQDGEDFPYYESNGFTDDFLKTERFLCERDTAGQIVHDESGNPVLECMCGNIICGRTDPSLPFFTAAGSFWINSTTELLASTTAVERQSGTRTRCNGEGYESVALIPLHAEGTIIGLLQLNDRRPNCFTSEMIRFFEGIGASIGIALARTRAEEELRAQQYLLQEIASNFPNSYISIIEKDLTIGFTSGQEFIKQGHNPADFIGLSLEHVFAEHSSIVMENYLKTFQGEETSFELFLNDQYQLYRTVPLFTKNREIDRILVVVENISERKMAERELLEQEERFRTIFEQAADCIIMLEVSPEGIPIIRDINGAALGILGYSREELIGQPITFLEVESSSNDMIRERGMKIRSGETVVFIEKHTCKDGSIREFECSIKEIRIGDKTMAISVERDITQRKRLEEQLQETSKMEAIGRLAGGVAHDFNNALTPIIAISDLLLNQLDPEHLMYRDIKEMQEAGERCVNLTRQLLAFGRRQTLDMKVLNLNDVVMTIEKLLSRVIGEDIDVVKFLAPDLGRVKADVGQLEQIIVNLAVNSRDAMPSGGKLTIETANLTLDQEYAREHAATIPGQYVMLSVSDTGCGIDEKVRTQIFEPFFTTKEKGKGTGLGLSTVYGIVRQSGGNIWVYSEPGKGTTFKIYLPRIDEAAETTTTQEKASPISFRGSETILVVEDEDSVRMLIKRILAQNGYTVIEARNGEEAIKMCGDHKSPIHLIFTDVVMPGMSGKQMVEHLSPLYPDAKIIYASGYTDNAIVHHGVLDAGTNFIQKPFSIDDLTRKVRTVLDS